MQEKNFFDDLIAGKKIKITKKFKTYRKILLFIVENEFLTFEKIPILN